MPYPPRPLIRGGTYFITSRSINFEPYLQTSETKDIVLACIAKAQTRYRFELSAFGIMDEQLKLTIRTLNDTDTVSRIMQHIKANITRMVNRRMCRTGTIWNERFMSTVISCVKETADFIRRSLMLTASGERDKGRGLSFSRYDSLGAYLSGNKSGIAVTIHEAFLMLGDSLEKRREWICGAGFV